MLKIPADSDALGKNVQSGPRGPGVLISKTHICVHPVANSLHSSPSSSNAAEQLRSSRGESIDLAVPAVHQVLQDVVRQFLDGKFARIIFHRICHSGIMKQ